MAMNADNSTPRCAGTRAVKIEGNALEGMMAVFTESREGADASPHGNIRVMVTDGHDSFEGSVQVNNVKGFDDSSSTVQAKVDVLTSYLLDDKEHPSITMTLKPEQGSTKSIRIGMNKRTGTGINRQVFSAILTPPTGNAVGSISFCQALASAFQQEKLHVQQVEEESKKARADVEIWKDAQHKENQEKQAQRDELYSLFLNLYQITHKKLNEAEQQVQRASLSAATAVAAPKVAKAPSKRATRAAEPKVNADDQDVVEPYPVDVVESMATTKGRPRRTKKNNSDEASIQEEPVKKRRRNQASDSKENTDINTDDVVPAKKEKKPPATRKGKGRATAKKDEDDESDNGKKDRKGQSISIDEDFEVIDHPVEIPSADIEQPNENISTSSANAAPESGTATDAMDEDEEYDYFKQYIQDMRKKGDAA